MPIKSSDLGWGNFGWNTNNKNWGTFGGFGWFASGSADTGGSSVTASFNQFSMDFDGVHRATGTMNTLNGSARASWSFWFKRDTLVGNWTIIGKAQNSAVVDQFNFRNQNASPYFNLIISDGSTLSQFQVTTNPSVAANTWYHVLVGYNGGNVQGQRIAMYLNGNFLTGAVTVGAIPTTLNNASNINFSIGGATGGTQLFGPGNIDEVAIWNLKALTGSHATEIFNLGGQGNLGSLTFAGPTHLWRCGDNAGDNANTLADATGSANLAVSFKSGSGNVYVADVR